MTRARVFTVLCLMAGVLTVTDAVPIVSAADPTFVVSGIVTDVDGQPVTDATVYYGAPNDPGAYGGAMTDGAGRYEFSIAAGVYDISAIDRSDSSVGAFVEDVTVSGATQLDVGLVANITRTISGHIPIDHWSGDSYGTIFTDCGAFPLADAYQYVSSPDGSYVLTLEGPAFTHCSLTLQATQLYGRISVNMVVELDGADTVVDIVFPEPLTLRVDYDDSLIEDGDIYIESYGPVAMPNGRTANVNATISESINELPLTIVVPRSTTGTFVLDGPLGWSGPFDTSAAVDEMVVTLPPVVQVAVQGHVVPAPGEDDQAMVSTNCGEDQSSVDQSGAYELHLIYLEGQGCGLTLEAYPFNTTNVTVRGGMADPEVDSADLPYPEPLELSIVDADGQQVSGAQLRIASSGTVPTPSGGVIVNTSVQTGYNGEPMMTRLHRGVTPWTLYLENGLRLDGTIDTTGLSTAVITLPELTTYHVSGHVAEMPGDAASPYASLLCSDGNLNFGSDNSPIDASGSFELDALGPIGMSCTARVDIQTPSGYITVQRPVALADDVGVADISLPEALVVRVIDSTDSAINASVNLNAEGELSMPDGAQGYAYSSLGAQTTGDPVSAPLVRESTSQFSAYDYVRGVQHNMFIDTIGYDELVFDVATGQLSVVEPPEVTRVAGTVTLVPGLPLGSNTRATMTCNGQQLSGSVLEDGTYSILATGLTASSCVVEVRVEQGTNMVTFRRAVPIVDLAGSADFEVPPLLRVNVIDSGGAPVDAAGVINAFENEVVMPDGAAAYVLTEATLIATGAPVDVIALRDTVTYVNIEDYTHNEEYWEQIDTVGVDEITFDLATGTLSAGPPNVDGDGVTDAIEAGAPNGGDGNGDGTADALQDNVTSLPSFAGPYVTLAAPAGTTLVDVSAVDPSTVDPAPADYTLPDGLLSFTIAGVTPGGSATVRIFTPSAAAVNGYAKFHDGTWALLPGTNVTIDPGGEWIDITLVDGGIGDDDGIADGTIVDPGGIVELLDVDAPVVICDAVPTDWSATDVSIACTASDAGAGLADAADASFSLTTSVAGGTETASATTGSREVCDALDNCTTAGPFGGVKVDKKAPSITITSPTGATVIQGQAVVAGYSCADGGAGTASCSGPVANGATISTTTTGPATFTVVAADGVGNSTSRTVNYAVTAANTAPVVRADLGVTGLNEVGFQSRSVVLTGSFTDIDGTAPYTASVRWASTGAFVPMSVIGNAFAGSTVYPSSGTRVATVRVCDAANACGTDTITIRAGVTQKVKPVLQCVSDRGRFSNPRYVARFGYNNPASFAIAVPTVPLLENSFTSVPFVRGQPQVFAPGQQRNVFAVSFNTGTQTWRLNGATVSASSSTRRC